MPFRKQKAWSARSSRRISGRRSDLSVSVAAQKIITLVEARRLTKPSPSIGVKLTAIGKIGGGNFFYDIVQPLRRKRSRRPAKHGQAKEALALARKALKPEVGGILEGDLSELETSLGKGSGS